MLDPTDLILVLHDGARAAERKTISATLDAMADSLADLIAHRTKGDTRYRQDEISLISTCGSRAVGQ